MALRRKGQSNVSAIMSAQLTYPAALRLHHSPIMVTLRSEGKPAATAVVPSPSQTRKATSLNSNKTARRSLTPDRASQDSALRRSQRVKDRQGVLESIQEDTAASAGITLEKTLTLCRQFCLNSNYSMSTICCRSTGNEECQCNSCSA